jgi:hypothetical protein
MAEEVWDGLFRRPRNKLIRSNVRRPLTNEDHLSWQTAQDIRQSEPPAPRTIEDARKRLQAANPVKYRFLKRDFKWAQKEMKKMGLNPEDARWLL